MIGAKSKVSLLVYGASGAGKTTQIGELAEFVHETSGLGTRLISASGGGWGVLDGHVEAGLVEPTFIGNRPMAFEVLHKLSKGWWPEDPNDPESPLAQPADAGWDRFGAVAFDSATEIADLMMTYAIQQEAEGKIQISGQAPAAKFKDGESFFGASSLGMYGTVQNYVAQFVRQSKALLGQYVMWTALEHKVVEEGTRLPVYGPQIIGNAKTTVAPAWFDNVLHLHFEGGRLKDTTKAQRRMYLTQHFGDDGIPFLAKTTAPKGWPLPDFLTGDDISLGVFLRKLDESKQKVMEAFEAKASAKGKKKNA